MIGFVAPFNILDYLDRLNVVKQTSVEYHCTCPVCGDGGFKIEKKSGKYQAFKCRCEVKDIREAIRPWSEARSHKNRGAREQQEHQQHRNTQIKLTKLDSPA